MICNKKGLAWSMKPTFIQFYSMLRIKAEPLLRDCLLSSQSQSRLRMARNLTLLFVSPGRNKQDQCRNDKAAEHCEPAQTVFEPVSPADNMLCFNIMFLYCVRIINHYIKEQWNGIG